MTGEGQKQVPTTDLAGFQLPESIMTDTHLANPTELPSNWILYAWPVSPSELQTHREQRMHIIYIPIPFYSRG